MNQSKSQSKIGSSPLLILFKNFIYLFFYYYDVFWRGGGGVIPYMVSTEWYSRNLGLNTMQAAALYFQPSQQCVACAA